MNEKTINIIGFGVVLLGIGFITLGYFRTSSILLFIGIGLVIISTFTIMALKAMNLFLNDKKLDIEALKASGLTIVTCKNCKKENVKEDIYCIYCGEKLGD